MGFRATILRIALPLQVTLCCFAAQQAFAQSQNSISPADQAVLSPGQVDMRSGFFQHERVDATIGDNENGDGLVLVRTHTPYDYSRKGINNLVWNGPFPMTHNWNIRLYENRIWLGVRGLSGPNTGSPRVDFDHDDGEPTADYRFIVNEGSASTTFDTTGPGLGTGIPSAGHSPGIAMLRNNGNFTIDTYGTHLYWAEQIDGTRIDFSTLGKRCGEPDRRCAVAQSVTRPDGTRYDLAYISRQSAPSVTNDLVDTVISNRGYGLKFFYNFSVNDQPIKACLFNTAVSTIPTNQTCNSVSSIEVTYTVSNLSFEAHTLGGRSERVVSTAASGAREISFYEGGEPTPWIRNSLQGDADIVRSQVLADGRAYTYNYQGLRGAGEAEAVLGGTYSASTGSLVQVRFDQITYPTDYAPDCTERLCAPPLQASQGPNSIVDQLGRVSSADYCDPWIPPPGYQYVPGGSTGNLRGCVFGKIQSVTDPEGRKTEFRYGGNRLIVERTIRPKPGSNLSPTVDTVSYDCTVPVCEHKPTQATDGNGYTSNWEYSTDHGGLLRETLPPDASGVRPETRYTYGQFYAWLRNSGGSFTRAATPIWLMTSQYSCRSSAMLSDGNCSVGTADKVTTRYQYEQGSSSKGSNLHLIGMAVEADGQTLRTCYQYDQLGRRIAETKPLGTGATCP